MRAPLRLVLPTLALLLPTSHARAAADPAVPPPELRTVQTAVRLAAWAREAGQPVALALAGAMVRSAGVAPLVEGATPPLDAEALTAEALTLAGDDRDLRRAVRVAVASVPRPRGRSAGGPRVHCAVARPGEVGCLPVGVEAGRVVTVVVEGDGASDLDLEVRDAGRLVCEDRGATDLCACSWTPARSSTHRLCVENVGDADDRYCLFVQ